MNREELNILYDLLETFCDKYLEKEEDWEPGYKILDMVGENLKISDCWNIKKVS